METILKNKYNQENFKKLLSKIFKYEDITEYNETIELTKGERDNNIHKKVLIGEITINDFENIGFYEIEIDSINKRAYLEKNLKKDGSNNSFDSAIVIYFNPNSLSEWRISFIEIDANNDYKRFSYTLGENSPIKTALERFELLAKNRNTQSLESIKDAFSVEALNKVFFEDYKAIFENLNNYLLENNFSNFKRDEKNIRDFNKKLLGRIVFLYFLQKKGWLGSKESWGDGDRNFLQNHFLKLSKNQNFYEDFLKEIFFNALNSKRDNDYFALSDSKIPFLNGGLFEQKEFDSEFLEIDNSKFQNIFETLNRYNFTIIEDTKHDSEVAIDPEMLGRVFENLLDENYRSGKGAFYTPREIVHYMAKESIQNYLDSHRNSDKLEALKSIKILDPAIGSGAFPMGVLQELIELRVALGDKTSLDKLKKEIIENSIYGIDIDKSAVDIAKLRFWLSLVVDEDYPSPLPNLQYKIILGNSLIENINGIEPIPEDIESISTTTNKKALFDKNQLSWDFEVEKSKSKIDNLNEKLHLFFKEQNPKKKEKLQKEILKIVELILDDRVEELKIKIAHIDSYEIEKNINKPKNLVKLREQIFNIKLTISEIEELKKNPISDKLFLYKLWFGEVLKDGGFDIVIGNPPYLRVQGIEKNISNLYKDNFKSATGSYDLYVLFSEKAIDLLNKDGTANFIMPHKWINSSFGKGLRGITKGSVSKFISFGAYQVFNASTYTSLVWFSKKENQILNYIELDRDLTTNRELEKWLFDLKDSHYTKINNSDLSSDSWTFTDKKTYEILEKLKKQPLRISDVFISIFQGIATSKDSVYFLLDCIKKDSFIEGYSKELDKRVLIEKDLVKPLLKGDDVHRYEKLETNKYVVFPYYKTIELNKLGLEIEKANLYDENDLKEDFPKGYEYLKECETILRNRERSRFDIDGEWFQYGRKQGVLSADKEKLITPYLSLESQLSYDKDGDFYGNTKCFSLIKYSKYKESYKFYLAILNSKLMWFFVKNTSAVFRGGYFVYAKENLSPFPLPKIENIEDTKPFEILVDEIMQLKEKNEDTKELEDKIDKMVYELYGLSEDEVKIIENS